MIVIPAIDIRNGNCVRLRQGNFSDETVYSEDPVAVAKSWESKGAKILQIIDLDGAKIGKPVNIKIVKQIAASVRIPIQLGGGIQSREVIENMLAAGVKRIILSTLALENEMVLKSVIDQYSEKIIVSLDTRNRKLAKRGWLENTELDYVETAKKLEQLGVRRFIYTNVLKDGTLTKPDLISIKSLLESIKVPVIVAGGVSSVEDIVKLKKMGVEGVIIGKAFYERKITIMEANNVS